VHPNFGKPELSVIYFMIILSQVIVEISHRSMYDVPPDISVAHLTYRLIRRSGSCQPGSRAS
jgi:hypothetical protein